MSERLAQVDVRRLLPRLVVGLLVFGALLYIVVLAEPVARHRRQLAHDDVRLGDRRLAELRPHAARTGSRSPALLFIVASGFSLIFGLMRVVNMAHGSFYLLGGYIAYEVQQRMTGQGFTIAGTEVNTWEWVVPGARRGAVIGARRPRRPAGLPALEPGPGAAPGADHDRDLGDHRRPGDRPLQRGPRLERHLARLDEPARRRCRCSASTTRSPASSMLAARRSRSGSGSGSGSTAPAPAW